MTISEKGGETQVKYQSGPRHGSQTTLLTSEVQDSTGTHFKARQLQIILPVIKSRLLK